MKMNYFVAGTNDIEAAVEFYDALFDCSGLNKMEASSRMTYWVSEDFAFAVASPFDEQPATHGNGSMIGFGLDSAAEVEKYYFRALEAGGSCEGKPGQRGPKYSAYIRDLDKNKLCFSDSSQ